MPLGGASPAVGEAPPLWLVLAARSRCCSYLVLRDFSACFAFFLHDGDGCVVQVALEHDDARLPAGSISSTFSSEASMYDSYAPPQPFGADAFSIVQPTSTSLLPNRKILVKSFVEYEAPRRTCAFRGQVDVDRVFVAADVAGTATQFFKPRTRDFDLQREPERDAFFEEDVFRVETARHFEAFVSGHFDFDVDVLFFGFLRCLPAFSQRCGPFLFFLDGLVEERDPLVTFSSGASSVSPPCTAGSTSTSAPSPLKLPCR